VRGRFGSLNEVEGESTQDDLRLQSGLLVELQDSVEVAGIGLARMKEPTLYAHKVAFGASEKTAA
jgi:hypothetical protein